MKHKIELLAPAGDWNAFVAAVENGADAVYLGGKLHNARQFAGNFDSDNLKKAIEYAHIRDVNVYLTMNTLITDRELPKAVEFINGAYLMGIDAVIVQDLGFARLLRKSFPDLELHASTQMTIYNLEGVQMLSKLGFSRVITARELSLEEICHITQNTKTEIEVFIHGAMCVCYSGQCLMSSIIGGRSGNRGKCAQPCRLPYSLVNDEYKTVLNNNSRYILSPKDMCTVHNLEDIVRSGVKSLKIEGRMKSPEYVATVVRIYRKYLDKVLSLFESERLNEAVKHGVNSKGSNSAHPKVSKGIASQAFAVDEEDERDLLRIFNRGGFSKGYFYGIYNDMMAFESPKNQGIYLGKVISFNPKRELLTLKIEDRLANGDGIEIRSGEANNCGTIISFILSDGKKVDSAKSGEIVEIGFLKGKIFKGDKVYKTYDRELNRLAGKTFEGGFNKKTQLQGKVVIKKAAPAEFEVWDKDGHSITVTGEVVSEPAIKRALTKELLIGQLKKTGSTPFEFESIEVIIEGDLSLPISEINNIRRKAIGEIEKIKSNRYSERFAGSEKQQFEIDWFNRSESDSAKLKTSCYLENLHPYREENSGVKENDKRGILISLYLFNQREIQFYDADVDRVYIPFSAFINGSSKKVVIDYINSSIDVFVWLPSITRGNYDKLIRARIGDIASDGIKGILIGNLGSLSYVKDIPGIKIVGDYTLNCYNSFSLKQLRELGLSGTTLSCELTLRQIQDFENIPGFEKEIIVYGRLPLMISEYCPTGTLVRDTLNSSSCARMCEKSAYYLKDRKGMKFPVISDRIDCRSTILNSNILYVPDIISDIYEAGVNSIRINVFDETPEEIKQITSMYKDILRNGKTSVGHYSALAKEIESQGFTKGHFFRGV